MILISCNILWICDEVLCIYTVEGTKMQNTSEIIQMTWVSKQKSSPFIVENSGPETAISSSSG